MSEQTPQQQWLDRAVALASEYGRVERRFTMGRIDDEQMNAVHRRFIDHLKSHQPHTQLLGMALDDLQDYRSYLHDDGLETTTIDDLIASIKQTIGETK